MHVCLLHPLIHYQLGWCLFPLLQWWETIMCFAVLASKRTANSDPFAVAVLRDKIIVGHVPRNISFICLLYLHWGVAILTVWLASFIASGLTDGNKGPLGSGRASKQLAVWVQCRCPHVHSEFSCVMIFLCFLFTYLCFIRKMWKFPQYKNFLLHSNTA